MKIAFGVIVFIWVLCGLIGAWRLGEMDVHHVAEIAKGPFTLARAFNEEPVSYPGPN